MVDRHGCVKGSLSEQTYRVSSGLLNFYFLKIPKQLGTKSATFTITSNKAADLPLRFGKCSLHLFTHRLINVNIFSCIPSNPANTSAIGQQTRKDIRVPLLVWPCETNQGCLSAWSVVKRFVGFFSIMFPMKSLAVEVRHQQLLVSTATAQISE